MAMRTRPERATSRITSWDASSHLRTPDWLALFRVVSLLHSHSVCVFLHGLLSLHHFVH